MKIFVTGTQGIAQAVTALPYNVVAVSRQTGHDIADWRSWVHEIKSCDVFVNNAQNKFYQTELLVHMAMAWKDQPEKIIVNIGSMVADYQRTTGEDNKFWDYRLEKQSLQNAYIKLSRDCQCRIALINPGAVDTAMVKHLQCNKMPTTLIAEYIDMIIKRPELRRLDLWL